MIIQFVSKLSKGPALDKLTFSLKGLDACPGRLTSSGNGTPAWHSRAARGPYPIFALNQCIGSVVSGTPHLHPHQYIKLSLSVFH